jgi:hypothetical protein
MELAWAFGRGVELARAFGGGVELAWAFGRGGTHCGCVGAVSHNEALV